MLKIFGGILLPGVFWIYFFFGKKDFIHDSLKYLLITFGIGIISTFPAIVIEFFTNQLNRHFKENMLLFALLHNFLVIGPLEEYLKWVAVALGIRKSDWQDSSRIFAHFFCAAIGFSCFENFLYAVCFGIDVLFQRMLITTLAHIACSGLLAYAVAWRPGSRLYFFVGFLAASLFHSVYDFSIQIFPGLLYLWIPVLFLMIAFLESRLDDEDLPDETQAET